MPITYDDRLARMSLRLTVLEADEQELRRKIRRLREDIDAALEPPQP